MYHYYGKAEKCSEWLVVTIAIQSRDLQSRVLWIFIVFMQFILCVDLMCVVEPDVQDAAAA